jgi:hypothetical protein
VDAIYGLNLGGKFMTNVIRFLESVGQRSDLRNASSVEIRNAAISAGIDSEIQAALLNRNQAQLEFLLGANSNVCCMVAPAKDDEDEESAPNDDEIRFFKEARSA